jgi:hypothetical protein
VPPAWKWCEAEGLIHTQRNSGHADCGAKYLPIKLSKEQKQILKSFDTKTAFEKLPETGLRNFAIIEETHREKDT